jgi:hypothetical protein
MPKVSITEQSNWCHKCQINTDTAVIMGTKNKYKGSKEMKKYKMIYSGVSNEDQVSSGITISIRGNWNKILIYKWTSYRTVMLRITAIAAILEILVIRIHAPIEGKDSETIEFYNELQHPIKRNHYLKVSHFWCKTAKPTSQLRDAQCPCQSGCL